MPRLDKRPVNLSLRHFHFPLNAWLSIGHRISGIILVFALLSAFVMFSHLWLNPDSFTQYQAWLSSPAIQLLLFFAGLALWFHWLAGLRFLIIEFCQIPACQTRVRQGAKLHLTLWLTGGVLLALGIWL